VLEPTELWRWEGTRACSEPATFGQPGSNPFAVLDVLATVAPVMSAGAHLWSRPRPRPGSGGVAEQQLWLNHVQETLRRFAAERGWERFHTPRNLVLALTGEVGELAELFQWVGDGDTGLPESDRLADEIADVFIYLLRLADVVNVDVPTAVADKIDRNRLRFPTEL